MAQNRRKPKATLASAVVIALIFVAQHFGLLPESWTGVGGASSGASSGGGTAVETSLDSDGAEVLARAFENHQSEVQVEITASVERVPPDDREGSQHQRFIVRISKDQTVLVAHNIDLAPRVPLNEGDTVTIFGQYEWNDRGGVLHWTHHDPGGRHVDGWIRHAGKTYQ